MNGPGTELLPTASARATWRAVRMLLHPHRMLATTAAVTLLGGTASGLLVPPILGHVVDLVLDHRGPDAITAPIVLLLLAALAQTVLSALADVLVAKLGETMLATLREHVLERALVLPLERVERAGSGDLIARISGDVSVIAAAVRSALPVLAGAALTVSLTLVGLAALDWRFALAGLLAAPIQLHTLRWYLARSTPVYAAERVAEGARTQQLLDSIGGSDTVRAFGLRGPHVDAVRRRSQAALDYALASNRLSTRFFGRLNLAELVGLGAIMTTGFWLVGGGAVTVGAAAAAALYFHRLFDPINSLLGLFGTAQEADAGLARLVGIADIPPTPAPDGAVPHDAVIEASDVDFAYITGNPVLSDVIFSVGVGEHVALVGTSGAGKTTLAKLVAGVHRPGNGEITIGGVPTHDIAAERLRSHVALVTQEVHVFAGALADDLRLARPEATDEQLLTALQRVGARTWADALPDALDTLVGEGGHRLTATQSQQLALARLVLLDPDVAVLDEATADAGSAGARELDRAADEVLRGRTALVVAHRLSQAARADRILVLDAGRIVESGTHEELLRAGRRYAQLWSHWSGSHEGA